MQTTQAFAAPAPDRRTLLKSAAMGLFAFTVGGADMMLSPAEARTRGAALKHLSADEAALLEAFGEALAPGARSAGIAHFVDANLARPHHDSLLTARYLDVLPPHDVFYRSGLAALDAASRTVLGAPFTQVSAGAAKPLIAAMLPGTITPWNGPPPPLFYLAVRSDAADLVYGTRAAFARMQVPYMAHIEPPADW
jgi:Gluconate 2-dehydrogenase subunit 3